MKKHKYKFTGENGEFIPSPEYIPEKEGHYSIGYLEELCEWVYNNNNSDLTEEEKLKQILQLERIIEGMVKNLVKGCGYIPTWSKKLKEKLEII